MNEQGTVLVRCKGLLRGTAKTAQEAVEAWRDAIIEVSRRSPGQRWLYPNETRLLFDVLTEGRYGAWPDDLDESVQAEISDPPPAKTALDLVGEVVARGVGVTYGAFWKAARQGSLIRAAALIVREIQRDLDREAGR